MVAPLFYIKRTISFDKNVRNILKCYQVLGTHVCDGLLFCRNVHVMKHAEDELCSGTLNHDHLMLISIVHDDNDDIMA